MFSRKGQGRYSRVIFCFVVCVAGMRFRSLSTSSSKSVIKHFESRVVPFSKETFFGVIADVAAYETFLPWCTQSRILHSFSPVKFDAELSVGFRRLNGSYISRVTLVPFTEVNVVMHSSPLLKCLNNNWKLEDAGERNGRKHCKITFDVSFEFRNQIMSYAAQVAFQEVHQRLLSAFLQRAEDLEQRGIKQAS